MNALSLLLAFTMLTGQAQTTLDTYKFRKAIREGDLTTVQTYLKADPGLASLKNSGGLSAIMLSVYFQKPEITKELQAKCGPLDIFEASAVGDTARVTELLGKYPGMAKEVYIDGHEPLHLSAFFGHVAASELLLKAGADPNYVAVQQGNRSPLHSACATASEEVATKLVAMMLRYGANPNLKQEGDLLPLHEAAAKGHMANVKALVEAGSLLSEKTQDGKTPLDLASERGHKEVVEYLKSKGAK